MPYVGTTWVDGSSGGTSINATRLNNLESGVKASASVALSKKIVGGASYTLVAGDEVNTVLHFTSGSAVTVTLPPDSVGILTECAVPWRQFGAGRVSFVAGSGVTVLSRGSVSGSAGQYAEGVVTKVAANTWLLSGDLA